MSNSVEFPLDALTANPVLETEGIAVIETASGEECMAQARRQRQDVLYMANPRRKLEANAARPLHLTTETGVGYRFRTGSADGSRPET